MDQYNLPGFLDTNVPPSYWQDLLQRLQLSGNLTTEARNGTDVAFGSGRIGYAFPLSDAELSVGLLGGGSKYKVATPQGTIKGQDIGLRGIDAAYTTGPNTFGASYQKQPTIGDIINLFYQRQF